MLVDDNLHQFATDVEKGYIDAVKEHGSCRQAAIVLGRNHSTITKAFRRLKLRAAKQGYAPEHDLTHIQAPGYVVKGVSTAYNSEGKISLQWVKTDLEKAKHEEAFQEFIDEFIKPLKGLAKPTKQPKVESRELLSAYIIGDAHFGLYSWDEETGDNFDSDIAVELTRKAIDYLVNASPKSEKGLLVNVGDFLHMDNPTNMTPRSGNILDVDTRFSRVIRMAAFSLRYCIEQLLKKHKYVEVINARGNHDPTAALFLSNMLAMYYEREKRVTIQSNASAYNFYDFGINLVGVTHGDKRKLADLPQIMAAEVPTMWGNSINRMWWTGHIHHKQRIEFQGCEVESFNTLAARDSWHAEHGYKAKRSMTLKVLHKDEGIVSESFYNVT